MQILTLCYALSAIVDHVPEGFAACFAFLALLGNCQHAAAWSEKWPGLRNGLTEHNAVTCISQITDISTPGRLKYHAKTIAVQEFSADLKSRPGE
jgi:hypothetical protein